MNPTQINDLHIELIINFDGGILEITSGKFAEKEFSAKDSIYNSCPYLIGTTEALPYKEPFLMEGMILVSDEEEYNVDVNLFKNDETITVLILNRTNVYKVVNRLNQGRNDLFFLQREIKEKNKELVRLREVADKANEEKSRFLAMMSHEVRNPLNVILGYTELINNEKVSPKIEEYLKYLTISGKNLKVIVDDILDLSRVEAGKLQLANEPFSIKEVLKQIENNYQSSHKDLDIELIFKIEKNIPNFVLGDDVRIIQILTNLINNSIKFTPKGSVTTQVLSKFKIDNTNTILFKVVDTGRGMTQEQASKVFEEFTQNELNDNRIHKGAGLGLSIVKRLVSAMNGKVYVESQVNVGTAFFVEIPFEVDEKLRTKNVVNTLDNRSLLSLKGKKILVADDNFLNLTIVSHLLKKEEVNFVLAKDGLEALAQLEKANFDLVLLGINMPNLSGEELVKRKKELSKENSEIPFLALTANNTKEDILKYHKIGFKDVIPKPFTSGQFIDILKRNL